MAEEFFTLVLNQARRERLLSDDHFTTAAGTGRRPTIDYHP